MKAVSLWSSTVRCPRDSYVEMLPKLRSRGDVDLSANGDGYLASQAHGPNVKGRSLLKDRIQLRLLSPRGWLLNRGPFCSWQKFPATRQEGRSELRVPVSIDEGLAQSVVEFPGFPDVNGRALILHWPSEVGVP